MEIPKEKKQNSGNSHIKRQLPQSIQPFSNSFQAKKRKIENPSFNLLNPINVRTFPSHSNSTAQFAKNNLSSTTIPLRSMPMRQTIPTQYSTKSSSFTPSNSTTSLSKHITGTSTPVNSEIPVSYSIKSQSVQRTTEFNNRYLPKSLHPPQSIVGGFSENTHSFSITTPPSQTSYPTNVMMTSKPQFQNLSKPLARKGDEKYNSTIIPPQTPKMPTAPTPSCNQVLDFIREMGGCDLESLKMRFPNVR
jgi:hypothetical protein